MLCRKLVSVLQKKILGLLFLFAGLTLVFSLTFQAPVDSKTLSESVLRLLSNIGIKTSYVSLRSNAHIIEYFLLGIAVFIFCYCFDLKTCVGILAGVAVGFFDECLKVFLPGREFSWGDFTRDVIGILLGLLLTKGFLRLKAMFFKCDTREVRK